MSKYHLGHGIALALLLTPFGCLGAEHGAVQVGAARVDITPDVKDIPRPYTSIHDPINARAIYIDNGHECAVLLNADVGAISNAIAEEVSTKISDEFNVPPANILISATHDHNAIFGGPRTSLPGSPQENGGSPAEVFGARLKAGLIEASEKAKSRMQPARVGFGTGRLYLNVNRDAIDNQTRLWAQEPNFEYPSDKTLAVIKFESFAGKLIAVYMNYAMHANSLFLEGMISGDVPGEAERYIERTYGEGVVALWTSGAAGDQNPIYLRPNQAIASARIHAVIDAEHVDLGTAIMHAMFTGNAIADKIASDPVALEQSLDLVKAEGQITAEETIRVMNNVRVMNSGTKIDGARQVITCPARRRLDAGREGAPGKYEDTADPVRIKIGVLRIGDIVLGNANAELYSMIGQRVKAGSKFKDTVMVTLTNGMANSGYIPTDDAFGRYTFQVLSSSLKPGCAEQGIETGIDRMIEALN